jgi:hypothetical protein
MGYSIRARNCRIEVVSSHLYSLDIPSFVDRLFIGGKSHADHQPILRDHHPAVLARACPAHFHALYGEYEVLIDIRTLETIKGGLPRRALALVLEWAAQHRTELMEDWNLCQSKQLPKSISSLE